MLEKLRNLLFNRHHRDRSDNRQPDCGQKEAHSVAGAKPVYLLLTRRLSDSSETIAGFRELYYCTTCEDYFVLGWHPRFSPLMEQCEVVEEMPSSPSGRDTADAAVFCPKCKSDYAMYGRIEHPEVAPERPEDARVYESFDYPFPPDIPSHPAGRIKIRSLIVEKIVVLVTGQFPDGLDVRDFAFSGFKETVLSRYGGEFLVTEHGGIRLHLIRVSVIVDETAWLMPLLEREVYQARSGQPVMLFTYGLVSLKTPLKQALFCLVLSTD